MKHFEDGWAYKAYMYKGLEIGKVYMDEAKHFTDAEIPKDNWGHAAHPKQKLFMNGAEVPGVISVDIKMDALKTSSPPPNTDEYVKDPSEVLKKFKELEAQGFTIYKAKSDQLLLDIDSKAAMKQYKTMLPLVQKMYPTLKEQQRWKSKSGNDHICLSFGELDAPSQMAKLIIQSTLGSDPVCEWFRYERYRNGVYWDDNVMLFIPPPGYKKPKEDKCTSSS